MGTQVALNLRNVPKELRGALRERATKLGMTLHAYCVMILQRSLDEDVYVPAEFETNIAPELIQVTAEVASNFRESIKSEYEAIVSLEPQVAVAPEPKPVEAPAPAPAPPVKKAEPKLCPKCKREKLKARDENTWRCPLCGYQEPR